ncbi:MAG: hypothetical protein JWN08_3516 [Frankiales bacterium]|nr:hypothetical protein [Frankiales bacterium]
MASRAEGERAQSSISRRRAAARDRSGEAYTRRRSEIVAAAATIFRQKGYQATTLADVSEAVGVDRASLYFYVSSKDEIFDEIVTELVKANTVEAERIAASAAAAPAKLRTLVLSLMRSYSDNYPFLYVYLQQNLSHVSEERQGWAAELRGVNRRYEAAVQAIVQQGVDDGSLRPVLDARVVAFGLMGIVSWTHRWFNPETSLVQAREIGEEYASMLLDGLVARPGEPVPVTRPVPHPDVVALVARFTRARVPTYDTLSVPEARAMLEGVTRLQKPPQDVASVRDVEMDGDGGHVPGRVYVPDADGPLPVVVYLHGGGFVLGSLEAADAPCRALANAAPCIVVSVDYRRAPETKFPGPLEDCVRAVRWVARHAADLGGSDRLVLLGDSAGAGLAAAAAAVLRDEGGAVLAALVLLYPTLAPSSTTDFASYRTFADGPLMTRRELDWFWDHYLRGPADARDPAAAPLHAPDLAGLPATTIVVPELDPLHDEGVAYSERLRGAGVPVRLLEIRGAAHGFWWMDAVMSQADELTAALVPAIVGDAGVPA